MYNPYPLSPLLLYGYSTCLIDYKYLSTFRDDYLGRIEPTCTFVVLLTNIVKYFMPYIIAKLFNQKLLLLLRI